MSVGAVVSNIIIMSKTRGIHLFGCAIASGYEPVNRAVVILFVVVKVEVFGVHYRSMVTSGPPRARFTAKSR